MTTTPAIETVGLTKSYADHAVLRGVDLSVPAGTIVALLGSNGAGKTTLVKILATLLKADGGTAAVCGHDVARHPQDVRAAISLTGQFAAVDEVLTGRENLVLVARLRRVADPRAAADALLARFDLTDAGDRRAGTYSGGMRRRLDIAMSLVGDPRVLVLDEPTSGLDPQSRAGVWRTVRAGRGGHHGPAHHAVPRRGRTARRPDRRAARGPHHRRRNPRRAQAAAPPARVEHVEKQPTLEDVFLAIVGRADADADH